MRNFRSLTSSSQHFATEHGFSVGGLFGGKLPKAKAPSIAKYANPTDPADTWTGRGRKPNCLVAR
ncbi:H-NS histone family protein [Hyphomicrobium sp.]|uniref:H-NS histone family protein n=1 Tax=Hyphomicrobium sp. TaxID=82 RepID=UPI0025B95627|nr:H-NS histone family protein [Hyphomicrobium sp.]